MPCCADWRVASSNSLKDREHSSGCILRRLEFREIEQDGTRHPALLCPRDGRGVLGAQNDEACRKTPKHPASCFAMGRNGS